MQSISKILIFACALLDSGEEKVFQTVSIGSKNRVFTYYMQSTGMINDDVEEILDAYFRICSKSNGYWNLWASVKSKM